MIIDKVQWVESVKEPNILSNYGINFQILGKNSEESSDFCSLKQVHSVKLVEVDSRAISSGLSDVEGDGLYCFQKHLKIGVKTADCLPIILSSKKRNLVCVIHAGWRGLSAGILTRMLKIVLNKEHASDIIAYLGPCIGPTAFEVGDDVIHAFRKSLALDRKADLDSCILEGKANKWYFDLSKAAVYELLMNRILPENISVLKSCTYINSHLWNSYRREKPVKQFNWTIAWLS